MAQAWRENVLQTRGKHVKLRSKCVGATLAHLDEFLVTER